LHTSASLGSRPPGFFALPALHSLERVPSRGDASAKFQYGDYAASPAGIGVPGLLIEHSVAERASAAANSSKRAPRQPNRERLLSFNERKHTQ